MTDLLDAPIQPKPKFAFGPLESIIGLFQMVGGVWGLYIILSGDSEGQMIHWWSTIPFIFSIVAGGLFYKGFQFGYWFSVFNFIFQSVSFVKEGAEFMYTDLFSVGMVVLGGDLGFFYRLKPLFLLQSRPSPTPDQISLNFIAILIIVILIFYEKKRRKLPKVV